MPYVLGAEYARRSAVEIFVKDLGIVQNTARNARIPVTIAARRCRCFSTRAASGMGRDGDFSVSRIVPDVSAAS